MVEARSAFAEKYGYVLHNDRTNSRRWFPALIKQIKGEFNKKDNFLDISEELSAARNSTIQGTQADFIKEASIAFKPVVKRIRNAYMNPDLISNERLL